MAEQIPLPFVEIIRRAFLQSASPYKRYSNLRMWVTQREAQEQARLFRDGLVSDSEKQTVFPSSAMLANLKKFILDLSRGPMEIYLGRCVNPNRRDSS